MCDVSEPAPTLAPVPATYYPEHGWIVDLVDDMPGARAADQPAWNCVVLWIGERMFGMICTDGRGRELLTLKLPPEDGEALRQAHAFIEAGWHLNKRHWTSIVLAECADRALLTALLEDSYSCLLDTLPRWRQEQVRLQS